MSCPTEVAQVLQVRHSACKHVQHAHALACKGEKLMVDRTKASAALEAQLAEEEERSRKRGNDMLT